MHMRIQLMLSPRPSLCAALVAAKIPQQSFSITNHAVFLQVPVRFSAIGVGVVPVPELRLSGQRWEGHQNNQTTPRLAVLFNSTENLLVGACGAGGGCLCCRAMTAIATLLFQATTASEYFCVSELYMPPVPMFAVAAIEHDRWLYAEYQGGV